VPLGEQVLPESQVAPQFWVCIPRRIRNHDRYED